MVVIGALAPKPVRTALATRLDETILSNMASDLRDAPTRLKLVILAGIAVENPEHIARLEAMMELTSMLTAKENRPLVRTTLGFIVEEGGFNDTRQLALQVIFLSSNTLKIEKRGPKDGSTESSSSLHDPTISTLLKLLMGSKGVSQRQVATLMGVNEQTISRHVRDETAPSQAMLQRYIDILQPSEGMELKLLAASAKPERRDDQEFYMGLARLREAVGLTVDQLATRAGMSRDDILTLEFGTRLPTVNDVRMLSKGLCSEALLPRYDTASVNERLLTLAIRDTARSTT